MSEYQYYEFQAVDHPLDETGMESVRGLSSRATVTPTSFTTHYNWGDFPGDPKLLMERWFDLHLYLANWGTRRLMMRLPKRMVDPSRLEGILQGCELVEVIDTGDNLILDFHRYDEESDFAGFDDGTGWLAALAPLRANMLAGDWRLLYLAWLSEVKFGERKDSDREPMAGIGPLTGALKAFAEFFEIDADLVEAAAELPAGISEGAAGAQEIRAAVASIPDGEKITLLHRLFDGDPHVAAELQNRIRGALSPPDEHTEAGLRTVSELRSRAAEITSIRLAAAAERREAERVRRQQEAEAKRRARMEAARLRGADAVWKEIEAEVALKNAGAYERATELLIDLQRLARDEGTMSGFRERLRTLRSRHATKRRFLDRLARLE